LVRTRHRWLLAAGCIFIAANLRPAVTAVGPLLEDIRASTGMSAAAAGLLTTLPLLAFGLVAPMAPRLGRRLGLERALLAAMVLLTAGLVLRWGGTTPAVLAGTVVIGTAIAVGNVLVPGLIKQDFPDRTGLMMALYSTTLSAAAGIAAGLSVPLAQDAGLGWRGALAAWGVFAAAAVAVWWPHALRSRPPGEGAGGPHVVPRLRGSRIAWSVTTFMGLQSFVFYGLITWLPTVLQDDGMAAGAAGWMVTLMQVTSLGATMVMPILATRRPDQRTLVAGSVVVCLAGLVGLGMSGIGAAPIWISLIGLGTGATFSLALTFLVLRAADARNAAALSSMAQSGGYLLAATGPIGLGLLHDATGGWDWPIVALVVVMVGSLVTGLGAGRNAQVGAPGRHSANGASDG
jgi:CP family cyanate transporter-like MFS transporter